MATKLTNAFLVSDEEEAAKLIQGTLEDCAQILKLHSDVIEP